MLNKKDREFLLKLADLFAEYKAGMNYTTDDDGIHIELDGREIFSGFLLKDYAEKELRNESNMIDNNEFEWDEPNTGQAGWYATTHCWDVREGIFVSANYWDGIKWDWDGPITGYFGPFESESDALNWARAHDPEV